MLLRALDNDLQVFPTVNILIIIRVIILNGRTQSIMYNNMKTSVLLHASASDVNSYLTSVRWKPLEASCRCYMKQLATEPDKA